MPVLELPKYSRFERAWPEMAVVGLEGCLRLIVGV